MANFLSAINLPGPLLTLNSTSIAIDVYIKISCCCGLII
jgi:hypothetical protein